MERLTGGLNDLEPSATQAPVGTDIPAFCQVSMAISLKRIADALEKANKETRRQAEAMESLAAAWGKVDHDTIKF